MSDWSGGNTTMSRDIRARAEPSILWPSSPHTRADLEEEAIKPPTTNANENEKFQERSPSHWGPDASVAAPI